MDIKSFYADDFNAKDWINNAYKQSAKKENKELFLTDTLSTLQVYLQQLHDGFEETVTRIVYGLPMIIRESQMVETNAQELSALSNELENTLHAAQQSAGQPLHLLQRTDRLKAKLELARHALQEADKWAALTTKMETALEVGDNSDLSSLTKLLEDMNECLDMLSGANDYEDKRIQLEALKNRLEAVLSPTVVEAFTEQHSEKCKELWKIFIAMRRKDALSIYRARCEAGALRSRIPSGISTLSPPSLRDIHAILLRHATHQLEWAPVVCPGEETLPWLVRLYGTVLTDLNNCEKLVDDGNKNDSSGAQLDQLGELLAACDHFCSEINSIINKEQDRKGKVSDRDLQNFGYAVYSPVRNGLSRLGRLLASAMADDLGTAPVLDPDNIDFGTTLQLRISKGLRIVLSRLTLGKLLSRNAAPLQLVYAAQWLIEELCSGWTIVDNLTGCLLLMKASSQLVQLVSQVESTLQDTKEDENLTQKTSNLPVPLRNWDILLKTDSIPIVSPGPLNSSLEKLSKKLRQKALNLVLAPISTHLDCIEHLQGWNDNDQYSVDLPDFSLSPQEYITQVGQYLMTLPQHLEPLLERDVTSNEEDPAYKFMNEVCNASCEMFAKKIDAIKKMDSLGIRKCSTDIAYLTSVLEELEAGSSGIQLLSDTIAKKQPRD